jgi:molecular chaperone DnaJ
MRPKNVSVIISLEEAYKGTEKNIAISRQSICRSCHGSGALHGEFKICPHCNGQGMVVKTIRTNMGMMRM